MGEHSSGRLFKRNDDGSYEQIVEHDFSVIKRTGGENAWWEQSYCARCDFTLMEVQDGLGPKNCPRVMPKGAEQVWFNDIGDELWRHPDSSRFELPPKRSLELLHRFRDWRVYGAKGRPKEPVTLDKLTTAKFNEILNEAIRLAGSPWRGLSLSPYFNAGLNQATAPQPGSRPPSKGYAEYVNGEPEPSPGAFKVIEEEYERAFGKVKS